MPSTTTVLFDLDHTICYYNQDGEDVIDAAFRDAGVEPFCDAEEFAVAANEVGRADSDHDFLARGFEIAANNHGGDPADAPAVARGYLEALDHTDVSFRDGAEAALAAVRESHRVGMVTNGGREAQQTKLESLGIADAFETVVFAGETTPPKPDTRPFELALDRLDVAPDSALHVGDSLDADVRGAREAGLRAAWYPMEEAEPDGHEPDHVLETLGDLPSVL